MTAKRNAQSKKSSLDVRRIAISVTALLMALLMLLPLVADVVLYSHAITQADIDATQASIDSTKSDIDALNQQKANLASQQVEAQKTLDELAKQENSAMERLNALEEKIGILADQINTTQEIIDEYDVMIQETQVKLADAQAEEETYYALFLERVRSMEEEGTVSYWEILFQSASFSDLLDRLSFVNDVMKYDNDMMDNLEAARQAVADAEAELESEQAEQEEAKAQLESEKAEQEEAADQEEQVLNEILANEELYSAQIEELSTQQEALVGEISSAQEELARQLGRSPSALANRLRLLHLTAETQQAVVETGLTERHARALLAVTDPQKQLALALRAGEGRLTVRQLEAAVAKAALPRRKTRGFPRDPRLFVNAVMDTVKRINALGCPAETSVSETASGTEIHILLRHGPAQPSAKQARNSQIR